MMNISNPKILALVVTYNRLGLLKECIESLFSQTYHNFDILVVNNGSTDGTKEYLDSLSNILVLHQENLGGAGGFYAGMKYMHEHKQYDALWMMDDDGLAASDQLEKLVLYSRKYKVDCSNALLLNREDHTKMNNGKVIYDKEYYDKIEFIKWRMTPFNGTLIYRYVIDKIGYIKKEMFIWGDEVEYTNRIKVNGFTYGTITKAIHYHPAFKISVKNVIPYVPLKRISIKPSHMTWIHFRNKGYIDATYGGHSWMFYSLYYILRMNIKGLLHFIKYYRKGMRGDFSK